MRETPDPDTKRPKWPTPSAPPKTQTALAGDRRRTRRGGTSRWLVVVAIGLAIALLGLIVFLHLSGAIGPGIH